MKPSGGLWQKYEFPPDFQLCVSMSRVIVGMTKYLIQLPYLQEIFFRFVILINHLIHPIELLLIYCLFPFIYFINQNIHLFLLLSVHQELLIILLMLYQINLN